MTGKINMENGSSIEFNDCGDRAFGHEDIEHMRKYIATPDKRTPIFTTAFFECKCGKTTAWVNAGQTTNFPCPECGRLYKGIWKQKDGVTIHKQIKRFSRYIRLYKMRRHSGL